ncbi:MAG: response regulator [Chitinivibrionales bacterium]|nr:response regulator [Chitinivibrionales bacterium]MBD3396369.1 response regulator [Chitinivibrionales bacterium]
MARVLIIDDEETVRMFCRDALERNGYEVAAAASASEGIDMYRADPADVVLMDVLMPKLDGADATEILLREFPGARVVAMSGGILRHPEFFLQHAQSRGAVGAIGKPFTVEELVEIVRKAKSEGGTRNAGTGMQKR